MTLSRAWNEMIIKHPLWFVQGLPGNQQRTVGPRSARQALRHFSSVAAHKCLPSVFFLPRRMSVFAGLPSVFKYPVRDCLRANGQPVPGQTTCGRVRVTS